MKFVKIKGHKNMKAIHQFLEWPGKLVKALGFN